MGRLLARKNRPSLAVEALEDRRLLSHPGQAAGWDMPSHDLSNPPIYAAQIGPSDPGRVDGNRQPGAGSGQFDAPVGASASSDGPGSRPSSGMSGSWDGRGGGGGPADPVGSPTASSTGPVNPPLSADPAAARPFEGGSPPGANPGVAPSAAAPPSPVVQPSSPVAAGPSPGAFAREVEPGPAVRPVGEVGATDRFVEAPPAPGSQDLGHPAGAGASLPLPISPDAPSAGAIYAPARGPVAINISGGRGVADAPSRPAIDPAANRDAAGARTSSGPPVVAGERAEEGGDPPAFGQVSTTRLGDVPEVPEPQEAGMISSLPPFDREALAEAVDHLLAPIDGLVASMPELRGPVRMVTASLALAVSVIAVDVAIRLRRSRREDEAEAAGVDGLVEFPGLPGARKWSRI